MMFRLFQLQLWSSHFSRRTSFPIASNAFRVSLTLSFIRSKHSVYRQLQEQKEIRLIKLLPNADRNAPVVCHILHESLAQAAEPIAYEALSYAWGDPEKNHAVKISASEDGSTYSTLRVAANTFKALRQLRYADQERLIWVDAICINQDDHVEKSQQVQLMRDIFSQAVQVLAFLGDEDEASPDEIKNAINFISRINNEERLLGISSEDTLHERKVFNVIAEACLDPSSYDWRALARLFNLPWFFRMWVIQEVVLAQRSTVIWGRQSIDWKMLAETADILTSADIRAIFPIETTQNGISFVARIEKLKLLVADKGATDLVTLMGSTRHLLATDPRDKLYGLLAMMNPGVQIEPDYDLEVGAMYRKFATLSLMNRENPQRLHILSSAYNPTMKSNFSLSSWVPDWTITSAPRSLSAPSQASQSTIFHACGSSQPDLEIIDERILKIRGKFIDTLVELGHSCPLNTTRDEIENDHMISINEKTVQDHQASIDKSEVAVKIWLEESTAMFYKHLHYDQDSFWQILACNRIPRSSQRPGPETQKHFQDFYEYYANAHIGRRLHDIINQSLLSQQLDAGLFEGYLKFWSYGRVLFASKNGHMGWAPLGSMAGDVLCIFFGASVPFVLRRLPDSTSYRLVGACYIHDLMDGQAIEAESFVTETFSII